MISIIVATTTNLVIGIDGKLPWHLPTDLKYFKKITEGKTVIMGKGCWESIPEKYRPLTNRNNIVLTSNPHYIANGASIYSDMRLITDYYSKSSEEVFVIGGAQVYKQAFPYANKLYMTEINSTYTASKLIYLDGFIPSKWKLDETSDLIKENGHEFRFVKYSR